MRQKYGDIYLHAQIYTGFMYLAAALCMWGLRGWKIGQLEAIAAGQQKKSAADVDVNVDDVGLESQTATDEIQPRSDFVKRLFTWKRV